MGKLSYVLLAFLFSCGKSSVAPPGNQGGTVVTPNDQAQVVIPTVKSLRWYPDNKWLKSWSDLVYQRVIDIKLVDENILKSNLNEIGCPGYESSDSKERAIFWVILFASISSQESAFDPLTRYYEEPLSEWSEGLLQLSVSNDIHGSECASLNGSNILEAEPNLKCGVRIMLNQIRGGLRQARGKGFLFPASAYYWSTLTTPAKKMKVINFFKLHLDEMKFCELG